MNTDAVFRQLEPPPGGAEAFAQRLDEIAAARPTPRGRMLAVAAAVAAVTLVTAILVLRTPGDAPPNVAHTPPAVDIYNAPEFDRLLGRSPQPAEIAVVLNEEAVAVTQVATANRKVRIYEIN